jgi:hypothetical protein
LFDFNKKLILRLFHVLLVLSFVDSSDLSFAACVHRQGSSPCSVFGYRSDFLFGVFSFRLSARQSVVASLSLFFWIRFCRLCRAPVSFGAAVHSAQGFSPVCLVSIAAHVTCSSAEAHTQA